MNVVKASSPLIDHLLLKYSPWRVYFHIRVNYNHWWLYSNFFVIYFEMFRRAVLDSFRKKISQHYLENSLSILVLFCFTMHVWNFYNFAKCEDVVLGPYSCFLMWFYMIFSQKLHQLVTVYEMLLIDQVPVCVWSSLSIWPTALLAFAIGVSLHRPPGKSGTGSWLWVSCYIKTVACV